ncbi:MAG: hypothetical protein CR982_08945 [Candidatus Cloacimonadota bacterium]|nr:MAG: hypothetical protein CR982_08945 [Candidatus Cloacimonadota bacterium]PIE78592.1 MAG: hypothetical protein CSA15_06840 [Candidatus Delongbacteria bacterium]
MFKKFLWMVLSLVVMVGVLTSCNDDSSSCTEPLNQSPEVTIDSPANGSELTIGEILSVEMTAMDSDGSIEKVDLYLNNDMITSLTAEPFSYEWNTANLEEGSYNLKAIATDNDGLTAESSIVTITLTDSNEAPMVTIDSPSNGSEFTIGDMVSIEMSATDNDGSIEKVDLYLNNDMVTSLTAEPFNYEWNTANLEAGSYNLKAIATDNEGLSAESEEIEITLENQTINDGFIFVEGGVFQMGDILSEGSLDESPVHSVTLNSFYISKYEVTQEEYENLMDENPSNYIGENKPVENITWYQAVSYCNKLSAMEGLEECYSGFGEDISCDFTKNGYRLPTEAEWEYAARGGIHNTDNFRYSGCNEIDELGDYAWYEPNSSNQTHNVGGKEPNQLGIYDMNGNVWEWCNDWYDGNYYDNSENTNPTGPNSGSYRIIRGSSWGYYHQSCRVASRNSELPGNVTNDIGFRVVRSASK